METALWTAIRVMDEHVSLLRRMGRDAHVRGHRSTGDRFEDRARDLDRQANLIRGLVMEAWTDEVESASG